MDEKSLRKAAKIFKEKNVDERLGSPDKLEDIIKI